MKRVWIVLSVVEALLDFIYHYHYSLFMPAQAGYTWCSVSILLKVQFFMPLQ